MQGLPLAACEPCSRGDMADLILVADDDPDIARFVEVNLKMEGFDVVVASNGAEALEVALERRPSLALLDVMMPKMDGVEVCRRLRADGRTAHVNVIMLTAKSLGADKVAGLTAGADDYIIKPFDPLELVTRVKSTLRRAREMRAQSPLTGLPGNVSIEAEVSRRLALGGAVALCYADLDQFKSYNDYYDFLRGDRVIVFTSDVVTKAAIEVDESAFIGHIGGDDFVIITTPGAAEEICRRIIERLDAGAPGFYETVDADRGYIEIENRVRVVERYPIFSISIGVGIAPNGSDEDPRRLAVVATEMKSYAKHQQGSSYAIDRRGAV